MTTTEPAVKTCMKCNVVKPLDDFYRHKMMADGRLGKCKECTKADVRKNRLENVEYFRYYDRLRSNDPKRIKARAEYAASEHGKQVGNAIKAKSGHKHANKKIAAQMVNNAVRSGKLKKLPCEVCGSTKRIHGHHDDYSKPLSVRWLCPKHHAEHHLMLREKERGQWQSTSPKAPLRSKRTSQRLLGTGIPSPKENLVIPLSVKTERNGLQR